MKLYVAALLLKIYNFRAYGPETVGHRQGKEVENCLETAFFSPLCFSEAFLILSQLLCEVYSKIHGQDLRGVKPSVRLCLS